MTTFVKFNPVSTANFQFNVTLDNIPYVVVCTYNSYSSRYYISVYSTGNTLILVRPMVGSPNNYDINLLFGFFNTSTMVYRVSTNQFEINP